MCMICPFKLLMSVARSAISEATYLQIVDTGSQFTEFLFGDRGAEAQLRR